MSSEIICIRLNYRMGAFYNCYRRYHHGSKLSGKRYQAETSVEITKLSYRLNSSCLLIGLMPVWRSKIVMGNDPGRIHSGFLFDGWPQDSGGRRKENAGAAARVIRNYVLRLMSSMVTSPTSRSFSSTGS